MKIRVGFGFDVHQLVPERELWLGGIKFEHELGLLGHSDADVLIHAICDALLGAANMRDIGYHFPDNAGEFKNIDSKILLAKTVDLIATKGYRVGNVDATVCAERPKLKARIPEMQDVLAKLMGVDVDDVSHPITLGGNQIYRLGQKNLTVDVLEFSCIIRKMIPDITHIGSS